MKKLLLITAVFIAPFALANTEKTYENHVVISNYGDIAADNLWLNGVKKSLGVNSGIFYHCGAGEKVEVQFQSEITFLNCGESLGINK